jgi:hypothetical protein
LHSASLAQLVGSQNCPSQRSPLMHSVSDEHCGPMKHAPNSWHTVPGGHCVVEPGIEQYGSE